MEELSVTPLICQGAEAKVFSTFFLDRPAVCKERQIKSYRLKELDTKINKQRLLHEARCLAKCAKFGISVPCVFFVDTERHRLYIEKIAGLTLKQHLWNGTDYNSSECIALARRLGNILGSLHEHDIVHGDLTTSNIFLRTLPTNTPTSSSHDVVLIDFGLGMLQPTAEDKAVDLYVLERAFISTHAGSESMVGALQMFFPCTMEA
ncbi:Kae1-associated serine/threonine protein kinase [archaeon]|nr:MAG: Kae1-associated serine/threonine protein kinase [archaeon]